MEWGTPVYWGWFLLFSRSGGHKTKETYPTPCKQGLSLLPLWRSRCRRRHRRRCLSSLTSRMIADLTRLHSALLPLLIRLSCATGRRHDFTSDRSLLIRSTTHVDVVSENCARVDSRRSWRMLVAYNSRMHLVRQNQGLPSLCLKHYRETMRMRNVQWTNQKKIPGFLKPRNFGLDEETSDKKSKTK